MKKIIGILGVAVIAATMFFNVSLLKNNDENNISVLNLASITQANAEVTGGGFPGLGVAVRITCPAIVSVEVYYDSLNDQFITINHYGPGHKMDCQGWTKFCTSTDCRADS